MRSALRTLLLRAIAPLVTNRGGRPATSSEKVLLIRPDHLGDLLFLTPAIRALRQARPDLILTVLVGPWAAGILAGNPDVDRIETFPFPWFDRRPRESLLAPYRRIYQAVDQLRDQFDTAVICRFDHWWGAWLASAAGIPRVIGYDIPAVAPFLTEPVPYIPGRHEVKQNLELVRRLAPQLNAEELPLRYVITEADRKSAASLLDETGYVPTGGPLVMVHPGSGAPVKRWSVDKWARLMDLLHRRCGAHFLVTGGPEETELANQVSARVQPDTPVHSIAGRTSLAELAALFERAALVIGPDSGPLHLAVAAGRPTLHLYGPVDPKSFGPWGHPARNVVLTQSLACQFCHRLDWPAARLADHPCVTAIPLQRVLEVAESLLQLHGAASDD